MKKLRAAAGRLRRAVTGGLRNSPVPEVPPRAYFGLTWGIPREFGGMTSVMLERSAALSDHLGISIDLLTLDPTCDPVEENARLRASGQLTQNVRIRNLWADLLSAGSEDLAHWFRKQADADVREPRAVDPEWSISSEDRGRTVFTDAAGAVAQVRWSRSDGSLCAVDDRCGSKRCITVCDPSGHPIAAYSRIRRFYFAWLDEVIGSQSAALINESKMVASYLHGYHRRNVVLCQVMHNSHLEGDANSPYGPYTRSRRTMIENNESFDVLAFLTQAQADDFADAFGDEPNRFVLPNSRRSGRRGAVGERDREAGIMLASLDDRKRVDHAIRALARVRSAVAHRDDRADSKRSPVPSLTVYGSGPQRESLQGLIVQEGLESDVRLAGYTTEVRAVLARSSYLLFTSKAEGMGLVLVEAMAEGCIPIAYDIRYGPSDIITDGVNGILVTAGDVEGLAAAIVRFNGLPAARIKRMRSAARRRAQDFSEKAVVRAWVRAVETAPLDYRKHKPAPLALRGIASVKESPAAFTIETAVDVPEETGCPELVADVMTSDRRFGFRVPAARCGERPARITIEVPRRKLVAPAGTEYTVFLRQRRAPLRARHEVTTVVA